MSRVSPPTTIVQRTKEQLSEIVASYGKGGLESMSMNQLLFIGPYLYEGLEREFGKGLTVKRFARAASKLTTKGLQDKMQRALQNHIANKCTKDGYQVRFVNERGYLSVKTLLTFITSRRWIQMKNPPSKLPSPAIVNKTVKYAACKSKRECTGRGEEYVNGMCQPKSKDVVGFEGIGDESGQRATKPGKGYVQSSHEGVFWLKPKRRPSPSK